MCVRARSELCLGARQVQEYEGGYQDRSGDKSARYLRWLLQVGPRSCRRRLVVVAALNWSNFFPTVVDEPAVSYLQDLEEMPGDPRTIYFLGHAHLEQIGACSLPSPSSPPKAGGPRLGRAPRITC